MKSLRCRRALFEGVNKIDMIVSCGFILSGRFGRSLASRTKVLDACVIGDAYAYSGERIKAFAVLKQGVKATANEMIAECKANPVRHMPPSYVECANDLPKSTIGKILRKQIRRVELVKAGKGRER